MELYGLRPGDILFGPIGGFFPGVVPVGVGQVALAGRKERISWRRWWNIRHVGVIVGTPAGLVYPRFVQAMPGGAECVTVTEDQWTSKHVYIRPEYVDDQANAVVAAASASVGTPYNFLTYLALALRAAGVSSSRLSDYITSTRTMMCSQLVDQALADAGFHVFDDGRLPQDVVPSELFLKLMSMPGRHLIPHVAGWRDNQEW